jgi:diguanylate cyclase (GGDEF)-like protein
MHRLLARQIEQSRSPSGDIDFEKFCRLVGAAYEQAAEDSRRTDRSMGLMIEELDQLNRRLGREVVERTADLRAREAELAAQNARFATAVDNMSQALLLMDDSARLVMCNRRYLEMYGLSPAIVRPGIGLVELLEARIACGSWAGSPQEYVDRALAMADAGKSGSWLSELPDGRTISILLQPLPGGGWVTTHEDITERRLTEMRIAHMARHDGLTGLPNREYLREQLASAIADLSPTQQLAVLYLDLDQFKGINDTLGHAVGDELLKAVADRLRETAGDGTIVSRLGGDEFVVVLSELSGRADAIRLADRLCSAMSKPFDLDGHVLSTETSMGVCFAPEDAEEPNELLKRADLALYRAKAEGRGSYRIFEQEMDARVRARHAMQQALRDALQNGEFEMYYQPVVSLRDGRIKGCEALIRWNHPVWGQVPPSDFIPVAEELGLIAPIGDWVIRKACAEAALWPPAVGVAVNLSPVQLRNPNLLKVVVVAIAAAGIRPERVELEITETALMHHTSMALAALHRLRDTGISISMDDFGTGYSSLSNLRSFPFDRIKIDRSFVTGLPAETDSVAIVRAVVGLARSLHMVTTAEGVETAEQMEQVRVLGCSEVQGILFSRPLPAADIRQLLHAQAGTIARQRPLQAKTA